MNTVYVTEIRDTMRIFVLPARTLKMAYTWLFLIHTSTNSLWITKHAARIKNIENFRRLDDIVEWT